MKDALMARLKIFLHREDNSTLVGIPGAIQGTSFCRGVTIQLCHLRFSSVITIPGRSSC